MDTFKIGTRRFLLADEACPHGWTVIYSDSNYQVAERIERRSTIRQEVKSIVA